MYDFYEVFTNQTRENIKSLMDNETYLSPDEAVKSGFADTVIDIKKRSFEMAVNIKTEINMSKTFNILNRVIAMVNKSDIVNQLYHTSEGSEIEIYQADPSTYKIGDRVNEDEGEFQLSDGAKLIVKGGIIEDIDRSVEVAPENQEEEAAPQIDAPETPEGEKEKVESIIEAPAEIPVEDPLAEPTAEFNEGPAPVVEPTPGKAKDAMPARVVEVAETKTTTETIAEEAPIVEPVPEVVVEPAPEAVVEPEAIEVIEPEAIKADDRWSAFDQRMNQLEAKAEEAEARAKAAEAKASKFENLATEAIDSIFKNTSSNFTPEAKANVMTPVSRGSIFSEMKKKAGLK
jgi:hypothetical protein